MTLSIFLVTFRNIITSYSKIHINEGKIGRFAKKPKFMKKINWLKAIAGLLTILIFTMCNINAQFGSKGSGNVIAQERNLPEFNGIESSGGIDVYITQNDTQKVVVETDDDLQKYVITKVEDGILKIYPDKWFMHFKKLKVHVSMKDLKKLSGSGGSDLFAEKPIITGNFEISLSGGSDANLYIKGIEISGSLSGGSDLYLKGAAGYLKIKASGGSDCKAYELTAAKADISTSGGSDVYITVEEELKASASGGSNVKYKGNAKVINSESSGGSDIIKE
jgi:hypothetical protein